MELQPVGLDSRLIVEPHVVEVLDHLNRGSEYFLASAGNKSRRRPESSTPGSLQQSHELNGLIGSSDRIESFLNPPGGLWFA
jgi:hypothetical protein